MFDSKYAISFSKNYNKTSLNTSRQIPYFGTKIWPATWNLLTCSQSHIPYTNKKKISAYYRIFRILTMIVNMIKIQKSKFDYICFREFDQSETGR